MGQYRQDFLQQQCLSQVRTWGQTSDKGNEARHCKLGWEEGLTLKECNGSVQIGSKTAHLDSACTLLSHPPPLLPSEGVLDCWQLGCALAVFAWSGLAAAHKSIQACLLAVPPASRWTHLHHRRQVLQQLQQGGCL